MVIETGKITLKDVKFFSILGTLPFERENEQPVILNVSVWLDFEQAARNEDLAHSVDYAQLTEDLKMFIRSSCFQLEETLVIETAKHILSHYPKIQMAEVSISKPNAIEGCDGAEASVRIRR